MSTVVWSEDQETQREVRIRKQLAEVDCQLCVSDADTPLAHDHGGYRIIDAPHNFVVAGADFDLTLDDVEAWLTEHTGQQDAPVSVRFVNETGEEVKFHGWETNS